jgi:hypothetical protein
VSGISLALTLTMTIGGRKVSARSIKETIAAPTDYRYPHMG